MYEAKLSAQENAAADIYDALRRGRPAAEVIAAIGSFPSTRLVATKAQKEAYAAEERIPPPEELYRAFYELQGIQDAMVKADPKWMLTSSGAYGEMRKGIEGTIKFVLKHRDVFSTTPDPNSPAYQKAAKEFMQRLDSSKGKVAAYLDKKAVDLGNDAGRIEEFDMDYLTDTAKMLATMLP